MSRRPEPATAITTAQRAATHEALYPRLAALSAELSAMAHKRPTAPVPQSLAILAEGLLFEAAPFCGPRRRRGLVPAPPDLAALAALLGQALAGLDAFETRHAPFNKTLNCFAWRLPRGEFLPVRRLRPETVTIDDAAARKRDNVMRDKLTRLITARVETAREEGYAAGLAAARSEIETGIAPPLDAGSPGLRSGLAARAETAPGATQP